TVARLMAVMGLAGVLRGKKVRTTISRKAVAAGDRVNRKRKLTAVCSHQTRIGNLDAHLI
ncbi:hypothetical protein K9T98_00810, partial [Escherichia coli]|nr:hypothetical protein [Escherichia coli]